MSPHSPRFSATFWNLLPFLWAGAFALIFTSHLVLLIEGDSNDSTVLGEQQSQLTSYLRRKTGLREREREWPMGSRSSYYSDSPVQRHSTGSPAIVAVAARPSLHQRPVFPKRLYALPPSPTSPSPTQASSAAPMLSIAKLIMHRHNNRSKLLRQARQARVQRQRLATQQQPQLTLTSTIANAASTMT